MAHIEISLILPAYNEVNSIAATIHEAKDYFTYQRLSHEIIVAADGNDGTRELIEKMAETDSTLKVIGGPQRLGKGRGIRQAAALATGTIIGFVDADNKTPIQEFDKVAPLIRAGYEVVIGSRKLNQSQIARRQPLYRRIGSAGFRFVKDLMIGLPDIADTQCGFKFFERSAARNLFARQRIDGYMFDVELLYLAHSLGYRIAQVPVTWCDDRDSRLALVRGNVRNVIDLFRIRFGSSTSQQSTVRKGMETER